MKSDELKSLLEQYKTVVETPKNKSNREYWDNWDEPYLLERWRGRAKDKHRVPFTMAMDISGYAPVVGIDCEAYYSDAQENLAGQLKYALWEFEHLDCHRYFEGTVFGSFGSVFEAAFFGAKFEYLKNQAPWYDEKQHVFEDKAELLKIKPFDFYHTGLMPQAIEFYEHHRAAAEPFGLNAMFPVTMRSPFSTAIMLRGFENLLMDIYDDPSFFHDLLSAVTESIAEFSRKRAEYLGEPMPDGFLFNDEISYPMISDQVYREMILPHEIALARLWGGVRYWHSCGVTQEVYESVSTLPGLKMMHIGPWSDIAKAAEVFGKKDIAIEICLNSNRDMYDKMEEEMREQLRGIRNLCDGKVRYSVRCDGIAILNSQEECMQKMKEWNRAAKEVFPD